MKLFNFYHKHGHCRLSFLGFTLFEHDAVSHPDQVRKYFLGGIFSSIKENGHSPELRKKHFRILGITLCVRKEDLQGRNFSIFGINVWKKSWEQLITEKSLSQLPHDADLIFLLRSNSGELFIFLRFLLPILLKQSPERNPLLVATKPYHLELVSIICPNIPCVLTKDHLLAKLPSPSYTVSGKKIIVLFTTEHFRSVEASLTSGTPQHYFHKALTYLGLKPCLSEQFYINIPQHIEQSALEKATSISLNLKNFVFFAPEANSCMLLPDEFWISLAKAFHIHGYDVYVNAIKCTTSIKNMGKNCNLTYSEAFVLARYARRIVSLRSGFTELLMETGVPLYIIYNSFNRRDNFSEVPAHAVFKGFTLSQLPGFNSRQVQEFIYEPDTEHDIQLAILN